MHEEECSNSLVVKEMQIKTTLRFHLTPVRMAIIKGKDVEKQELLNTAGGNEN
jgi:hypothetical protein